MKFKCILLSLLFVFFCCRPSGEKTAPTINSNELITFDTSAYQVAFLIMDGVFNTELTAPYDIFQYSKFRKGIKPMQVFSVANTKSPITTFEGLRILPDFDYLKDSLPPIDILVVPSAEHHLDTDLDDQAML